MWESVLRSLDSRLANHRSWLKPKYFILKITKKHRDIKRKNEEEIEEVHDNARLFIQ